VSHGQTVKSALTCLQLTAHCSPATNHTGETTAMHELALFYFYQIWQNVVP